MAKRRRIPRSPQGGYVVSIVDPNTGRVVKQSYGSYSEAVRARDRRNPSRMTKTQKRAAASKRAKQTRVAKALKKYLTLQNPAVKTAGAAVVKLKGGVIKITPIKKTNRARGRR